MQFTEGEIQEVIVIAREEFHQEITIEEAREITARFLHLLEVLARPGPHRSVSIPSCPEPTAELS